MPQGVPEFVPPSNEKIDTKRLKDDIPKFFNSRCFKDSHKEWWTDFLSDKEGIFIAPEVATTWLLDEVILIKKRQRVQGAAGEPIETPDVLEIPRPLHAQPEIEKLVKEQSDPIPQVNLKNSIGFTRTVTQLMSNAS